MRVVLANADPTGGGRRVGLKVAVWYLADEGMGCDEYMDVNAVHMAEEGLVVWLNSGRRVVYNSQAWVSYEVYGERE